MKKARIFSILFWVFSIVHLIGETVFSGSQLNMDIRLITKPFLMWFLIAWYFLSIGKEKTISHKLIAVGFVFSWFGDIFLMLPYTLYQFKKYELIMFLLGLVSFLITHIFYITAFNKERKAGGGTGIFKSKPWAALPTVGLFIALMVLLLPNIGAVMKAPIFVYAGILTTMTLFAANRYGSVNNSSFWLVYLGAVIFMLSDSMIAINKFYAPFESSRLLIMATYLVAQYLIAKGTIKSTPATP